MRLLIIPLLIIHICFSREIDSIGVMPLGLDLRKDITILYLIEKLGNPDSIIATSDTSFQIHYQSMVCYLARKNLYSIEISNGFFYNIEIGMSEKKIKKYFGTTNIIEKFPNNEEIHEYEYYDDKWNRYTINFLYKKNKLFKIYINKEETWL